MIVVHGIDYNHNGIYDNVLDRSELNNSLPGEATAPALCGPLVPTKTAATGRAPPTATTYAVVLHRSVAPIGHARGPASCCCATCSGVDATAPISDRASGTLPPA